MREENQLQRQKRITNYENTTSVNVWPQKQVKDEVPQSKPFPMTEKSSNLSKLLDRCQLKSSRTKWGTF